MTEEQPKRPLKRSTQAIVLALWQELQARRGAIDACENLSSVSLIVSVGRDGNPGRILFRTESATNPEREPR